MVISGRLRASREPQTSNGEGDQDSVDFDLIIVVCSPGTLQCGQRRSVVQHRCHLRQICAQVPQQGRHDDGYEQGGLAASYPMSCSTLFWKLILLRTRFMGA